MTVFSRRANCAENAQQSQPRTVDFKGSPRAASPAFLLFLLDRSGVQINCREKAGEFTPIAGVPLDRYRAAMPFNLSSPSTLLVRLPGTNKFLKATGEWTRKAERAFSFANPLNAIHACLLHGLSEVELVFRWEDAGERCFRVKCT
jgi:hypothetical protein